MLLVPFNSLVLAQFGLPSQKKTNAMVCEFCEERNLSKEEKEEGRRCGGVERDEESFSLRRFPPALREGMRLSALLDGGDPAVPMDG